MDYNLVPQIDWDTGGYGACTDDGGWQSFKRGVNAYYRENNLDTGSWKKKHHGNPKRSDRRASESAEA